MCRVCDILYKHAFNALNSMRVRNKNDRIFIILDKRFLEDVEILLKIIGAKRTIFSGPSNAEACLLWKTLRKQMWSINRRRWKKIISMVKFLLLMKNAFIRKFFQCFLFVCMMFRIINHVPRSLKSAFKPNECNVEFSTE